MADCSQQEAKGLSCTGDVFLAYSSPEDFWKSLELMCNGIDKEQIVLVTLFTSSTKVQASLDVNNKWDILDVTFYTEIFLA